VKKIDCGIKIDEVTAQILQELRGRND